MPESQGPTDYTAESPPAADAREQRLAYWMQEALRASGIAETDDYQLTVASDDASFRRYFRAGGSAGSFIFVDAPPDKEDSRPFVAVQALLYSAGLRVPRIYQVDLAQGFMMLEDFGNTLYLDMLLQQDEGEIAKRYKSARQSLLQLQQLAVVDSLPVYDETRLRTEMSLFVDWFLDRQLQLSLSQADLQPLQQVLDLLVAEALAQPRVFVHRDFHCRNLMVIDAGSPGIIDFQDAVSGPLTYDLASLLKDCYHRFPRQQVVDWVYDYHDLLVAGGVPGLVDRAGFLRWFDWMGMQRHLKCAGIFSRLNLRDGKSRYLEDIPLVMAYILEVCSLYPEFSALGDWLEARVMPHMAALGTPA